MNQEQLIEEFSKVSDIRIFLLTHPDREMVKAACLHFLGEKAQAEYLAKGKVNYNQQSNGQQ